MSYRFLIDNNLSFKIAHRIRGPFSGSTHVSDLGLSRSNDDLLWRFARNNGFAILTKDSDFEAKSRLYGCPPKVVQLVIGNCTTDRVISILDQKCSVILEFLEANDDCLLQLVI